MTLSACIPSINPYIYYFFFYRLYSRAFRSPVHLNYDGMLTFCFLVCIFLLHLIRPTRAFLVVFRGIAELSQIKPGKLLVSPHYRHGTRALHHLHHNCEVWVVQISLVRRLHGNR